MGNSKALERNALWFSAEYRDQEEMIDVVCDYYCVFVYLSTGIRIVLN